MFKKYLVKLNILMITLVTVLVSFVATNFCCVNCGIVADGYCPDGIFSKFIKFLSPVASESVIEESKEKSFVYLSGRPIGFSLECGGVVVVSTGDIKSNGNYIESPCKLAGIKEGDIIIKAEGQSISSGERLIDIVNSKNGAICELEVLRGNENKKFKVQPIKDDLALSYRIGVWVRDNSAGVGTITYVTSDGYFSALGHPIQDCDTGTIMPIGEGSIYKCSIVGIKKGERGTPGELKGLFLKNNNKIGVITENDKRGIRGRFTSVELSKKYAENELVEVAKKSDVTPGSAKILSTVDGSTPVEYNIDIVKTNHINSNGNRCMVIKITDAKLLEQTNGIVQGMSGSPVIQNGRLVGCVTHVFINDPTKGFAEFIAV